MTRAALAVAAAFTAVLTAAPAVSAQTLDQIVARNIAAKGGMDALRAVNTIRQTSLVNAQGMEAEVTTMAKRPNLMRQEMTIGGQTQIVGFDGQTPWMVNPAATGSHDPVPVGGDQAEMMRSQAAFDGLLVDYASRGMTAELVGTEQRDGQSLHHVRLTAKSGYVQHLYLDADTGLERRIVSEGPAGRIEQVLSDYRRVEGTVVPFRMTMYAGGTIVADARVQTVEFNIRLDDSLFRMGR